MRADWIAKRRGQANVSQMHFARRGLVTEEMAHVAKLERIGIGIAATCKINANIGNSAVTSDTRGELDKLRVCLKYGADTVMDLSTGGDIPQIREAILRASPIPVGTVPIYECLAHVKEVQDLTPRLMLDVIEAQAQQGVDYMTIHAGVLRDFIPLAAKRVTGIVSRGGALMAQWMIANKAENP